jgi:hypothetical protein
MELGTTKRPGPRVVAKMEMGIGMVAIWKSVVLYTCTDQNQTDVVSNAGCR